MPIFWITATRTGFFTTFIRTTPPAPSASRARLAPSLIVEASALSIPRDPLEYPPPTRVYTPLAIALAVRNQASHRRAPRRLRRYYLDESHSTPQMEHHAYFDLARLHLAAMALRLFGKSPAYQRARPRPRTLASDCDSRKSNHCRNVRWLMALACREVSDKTAPRSYRYWPRCLGGTQRTH